MKNIGFIGVGYMGYGIAKNILKHKNKLFVIANKNRKPIEKIVSDGAEEVKSFEDFSSKNLDAMFMCVTNTPIAKSISEKISTVLGSKTLIIDITTHNKTGSMETEKIFKAKNINYVECPVMGGPVQLRKVYWEELLEHQMKILKLLSHTLIFSVKNIFILDLLVWVQNLSF